MTKYGGSGFYSTYEGLKLGLKTSIDIGNARFYSTYKGLKLYTTNYIGGRATIVFTLPIRD